MSSSSQTPTVFPVIISIVLFIPFYIILFALWLLVFITFKTYRRVVTYIAYLHDPHLASPLSGMQAAQIRDFFQIHKKPGTVQVAKLLFHGSGPLQYEEIREAFLRRVVIRLDNTKSYPTLEYPELQKYFVNIMGYVFMKKDPNFNLKNHFSLYSPPHPQKSVGKQDLRHIWESLIVKPFPKKRSPWEVLLIDNYIPDNDELEEWKRTLKYTNSPLKGMGRPHYWVAFIRMHHALGDGFSIQKMLSHMSETNFTPYFPIKLTSFQRFMWNLRAATVGPYDAMQRLIRQTEGYHALHRPYSEHAQELHVVESPLIPTNQISGLKVKLKVPYTTILVSAISGGLRNYFIKYKKDVPRVMSTAIPVAIKDHSGKLGNEYSLAILPLAIGVQDPIERVEFIDKELKSLGSSSWIKMFDVFIDAYSSLPISWFQAISEKSLLYSSTYSTMPGPTECIRTFDSTLLDVTYAYGTSPDSPGFGISSITYNGFFRFVLFIDKNVVESSEAAGEIIGLIHDELRVLESACGKSSDAEVEKVSDNLKEFRETIKYD